MIVREALALAAVTSAQLLSLMTSGDSSSSQWTPSPFACCTNSSTFDKTQTTAASVFNLVSS